MTERGRPSDGQSISRAVQVLRAVAAAPGSSLGQIAKATGLARSTVQRLVNALNAEGLVARSFGQQGTYLGMELARLGGMVNLDARAMLAPLMEQLHMRTGETINLTAFIDRRVIVIEQFASEETIRVISYIGKEMPIHSTAGGKAHLSMLTPEVARDVLGTPAAFTRRTLTDPTLILAQVESFRQSGFFLDDEEYSEGVSAVAIALQGFGGRDLALSVAMPTHRYHQKADSAREALRQFRRELAESFGRSV